MTFPFLQHALPRRIARGLAWLASVSLVLVLLVAAVFYFWLLPNLADHRETVAALMSRAMGQRVTLEAVSAEWRQARPHISLRGMRVLDRQNRPALFLDRLDAQFAWRSLVLLEPRFTRLEVTGPAVSVRRLRDGQIHIGGLAINREDAGSAFSDWLLKQGSVHVSRATVAWHDEMRDAPPLVLRGVDLTLRNRFHRHRLQLRATPAADLAQPFVVDADLRGRSLADRAGWSGTIRGSVAGVVLPRLERWVDLPYPVTHGVSAANVAMHLEQGRLDGVSVALNARALAIRFDPALPHLALARVRGGVRWTRRAQTQRVEVSALRAQTAAGGAIPEFDMMVGWGDAGQEVAARNLNLSAIDPLLPALPVSAAMRKAFAEMRPGGRIDALRLRWQGAQPGDAGFDVLARFTGLRIAAVGARPGFSNLSGSLRGTEKAGVMELAGRSVRLDLPRVFVDPSLPVDTLLARGNWKKRASGTRFTFAQVNFANADAAGSAHGSYETVPGHAGRIDLNAHLTRGNATAVYRYLPKKLSEHTRAWVERAVVAGTSSDTQLTLRGDLERFPFADDRGGVFKVVIHGRNAVLDYVEGWPRIEDIDARVVFHGKRLEVSAESARIFATRLAPVKAVIADLSIPEVSLQVSGSATGPAQDFIRYANFSPVGRRLNGLTEQMQGSGDVALALNLNIPLHHSQDATLGGRLSFLDTSLTSTGLPRLERLRGSVVFTQDALRSEQMTAQFLGGPLGIRVATRDGQAVFDAAGRVTANGLSTWLGKSWSARLSGETGWRGQLVLGGANTQLRVQSDLRGMASRLPAPLDKPAAQVLPLTASRVSQAGGQHLFELRLGEALGAIWRTTAENRFDRGEIHFGGAAHLPQEAGLRLAGSGAGLDLSAWMSGLPTSTGDSGLSLTSIDLDLETLDVLGRRFDDVRLHGRTRAGLLRIAVAGRNLDGTLTYRAADARGARPARVSARFNELTLPAARAGGVETQAVNMKAAEMPMMDVSVDDFRLGARALGRLEATAHGSPQGLVIDNLQLTHADSVMHMNGVWHDTGSGETQANVKLEVHDAGRMLSRFGYGDALKRGRASINGDLSWEGTPADFGFKTLAGTLDFKAERGQFLKIEPGAARLLGVLSLQSLPRRLSFDFRDIFNDGFAFDAISATMRIARGVVYSDDFHMKGPAANVTMSGLARLSDETVQLRVKVNPKLSEGVAVAGALIGGPIAGLGMLAAQKLLRDPFETATGREYMITGPWREPDVSPLIKFRKQNALKDSDG